MATMMTRDMWGALSAFDWATYDRNHWRTLPEYIRLSVARAARAELRASETYVKALDAVNGYESKVRTGLDRAHSERSDEVTKLDEMRAYAATRREDTGTSLSTASELETLALAAIDEARAEAQREIDELRAAPAGAYYKGKADGAAEERARCVGALQALDPNRRNSAVELLFLAIETLEAMT